MRQLGISTQTETRLRTAARRLKSTLAAAEVIAAGARVLALLGKANFDPNRRAFHAAIPTAGNGQRCQDGAATCLVSVLQRMNRRPRFQR